MDVLEALHTRRSIRQYQDRPVPAELIDRLLRAAMAAPSARNAQPWHFVVLDDRTLLDAIPEFAPNAPMVRGAPAAILVCAELRLELSPGYWPVDCAAATENLLLAAHGLGLGAVWCGIYPREERMAGFRRLLDLPKGIEPHSLVVLGYPAEHPPSQDRYRPDRVHRNGW
ncbi:MAG: nitroreductase family protein [Thermoguttaceae bacterium]|jgi:nitroreductase|nr:nitroreductase family protein [Thermoguttaceae bacterium]